MGGRIAAWWRDCGSFRFSRAVKMVNGQWDQSCQHIDYQLRFILFRSFLFISSSSFSFSLLLLFLMRSASCKLIPCQKQAYVGML